MNLDFFSLPWLYWRESYYLLMLFLPVLFIIIPYIKQQIIWQDIADKHLLAWLKLESLDKTQLVSQTISKLLLTLSWLFLCVALAGPRTVKWISPDIVNHNVGVILVVDFSASMMTQDSFDAYKRISRIQQAENIISTWLEKKYK